jgi:hypothetical protein
MACPISCSDVGVPTKLIVASLEMAAAAVNRLRRLRSGQSTTNIHYT